MYSEFGDPGVIISDAELRAERVAYEDRLRYRKFVECAERFAAEHGLIVGGDSATRLLLSGEVGLDSFQYEFYSGRAPSQARALADALYAVDPDGLGHYTAVLTKVPNHLLTVQVDGREMFSVTNLPRHRGVQTADLVIPTARPAVFVPGVKLLCMDAEIQLMSVYADLCNPAKAADWASLLPTEISLRKIFTAEIRKKVRSAVGAGETRQAGAFADALRDYASGPGRVLIGGAALRRPGRLQVIATSALELEAEAIAEVARRGGYEITTKVDDPKVPTEPRLRRMTVYLLGRRKEAVLDVYNAGAFELVPYTGGEPRLGTPFVIMRFRLVDMWTIQLLVQMNVIDAGYAEKVLYEMLDDFDAAAARYEKALAAAADDPGRAMARLFPGEYVGRLEDPNLALKRAAVGGKVYYPYYPAQKRAE